MYNETFSATQAKQIAMKAETIMDDCAHRIIMKSLEFAREVSRVWEDKNAVTFFNGLKQSLADIGESMNKSHGAFIQALVGIANAYSRAGGMASVSILSKHLRVDVDFGMIKDTFVNSEYPDSFGFNDIYTAPSIVMASLDALVSDLMNTAQNAVDSIKAIPAFGNPQVQAEIGNSAGRIVNIIKDGISNVKTNAQQCISETARAYLAAGIASANAAAGIAPGDPTPPEGPLN